MDVHRLSQGFVHPRYLGLLCAVIAAPSILDLGELMDVSIGIGGYDLWIDTYAYVFYCLR